MRVGGNWSPAEPAALPARVAVEAAPTVKEPLLHGQELFWLEQRPLEQGRVTLLWRQRPGGPSQELTPAPWNLRSRVHTYGGGVVAVGSVAGGTTVVFVNDGDRCLWALELPAVHPVLQKGSLLQPEKVESSPAASPSPPLLPEPRRLTAPAARAFADGLIDGPRQRWIGVMECDGVDQLVAVPLAGGEPVLLHQPTDFCGSAVLSPHGSHLAWVEWQQPFMPWDRSQLWLGRFDPSGVLHDCRPLAGGAASGPTAADVSVVQPLWLPTGDLVVATDRSGWWNLERLPAAERLAAVEPSVAAGPLPLTVAALPPTTALHWQPLLPMEAEFGLPAWVYGRRTTGWDGQQLVAAVCRAGRWELGTIALPEPGTAEGRWQPLAQPFDALDGLSAGGGRVVAVAADAVTPQGLLEIDLHHGSWSHTPAGGAGSAGAPARTTPLAAEAISTPQALWFKGHGGLPTHAWYYPPIGGAQPLAPLLVKSHSGPTAMAGTGLNLAVQFWTSRGWGVVDVNYGGSTGFGRAYRDRLAGQWGVVDVSDCAAAATALVAAGAASPERLAIEGGSAGGFTTLAALCFTDVFRAGACRYGVADLAALVRSTHRFEAGYLEGLVGPWPAAQALYAQRSPLHHAGQMRCPVIFFQGLDDEVVPPEQTDAMAAALAANGLPVEVRRFAGEGHGFRRPEVRIEVLEATEAFFRRQFGL